MRKREDMTLKPCERPMARLKIRCPDNAVVRRYHTFLTVPGTTRKRRTRAALALDDNMGDLEDGENVVSGERRLHEDTEAGRRPSVEVLKIINNLRVGVIYYLCVFDESILCPTSDY